MKFFSILFFCFFLGSLAAAGSVNKLEKTFEINGYRQKSVDPDFNGIFFEIKMAEEHIENGKVRFFLTRKDLKEMWNPPEK